MASASSKTSNGKPVSNIAQCRGVSLGYADSYVQETAAIEGIEQPFRFTGREWDEAAQLYHYRARAYDPSTGVFIQEDPIWFEAGDLNVQRYVWNNPVMFTDPSGLAAAGEYGGMTAPAQMSRVGIAAVGCMAGYLMTGAASALLNASPGEYHGISATAVPCIAVARFGPKPADTPIAPVHMLPLFAVQTCPDPRKNRLQTAKNNACNRTRACKPTTTPEDIERNILRNKECIAARQSQMNQCFGGGDWAHGFELLAARRALNKCMYNQ